MDDFEILDYTSIPSIDSQKNKKIMLNPIEELLKNASKIERGLSIRQLKQHTNFSKNKIKHYIFNSKFIEDTPGSIHGSGKTKIKVYNFTPVEKGYFNRKIKKRFFTAVVLEQPVI